MCLRKHGRRAVCWLGEEQCSLFSKIWDGFFAGFPVSVLVLAVEFFRGQFVSDVVFVNIVYIDHRLLTDLLGHLQLGIPEPLVWIQTLFCRLFAQANNTAWARVVLAKVNRVLSISSIAGSLK